MSEVKKKLNNPFCGRNDGLTFEGSDLTEEKLAICREAEIVKKTGEGDEDFTVEKKLVIDKLVNRQEYIGQFADEVGILNVLKRVANGADFETEVNQVNNTHGYIDMTKMPTDYIDAINKQAYAQKLYNSLPDEIKNKLSQEDLIKIDNLRLANEIQTYLKLKEVKDGDGNV